MELRLARINGGEVLHSRGNPRVEIAVMPAKGIVGRALVPDGRSQ